MAYQSWLKMYEPKLLDHVIGQEKAVKELQEFLQGFKAQKRKAVIIVGPVGCGKTSTVLAIARHLSLEVMEVNASDTRNADEIQSRIGAAATQASLFSRGKVILVDEVDGLSGQQDRGGIPALVKVIESTSFPIVLTASDIDDSKFSPIKKASRIIMMDALSPDTVAIVLKRICQAEGVSFDELALSSLSRRCAGDIRSAINDLQALSQETRTLSMDIVSTLDDRNRIEPIENALIKVFKVSDALTADRAFESVGEDLDECLLWVEENLPKEYEDPASLARAFDSLARADVFRGRIRRWQHWRFLVYVNSLMTAGVAVAKDERKRTPIPYVRSKRLLSIYILNMKFARRKSVAKKIAQGSHASLKRTLKSSLPYLRAGCKADPAFAASIAEQFGLDEEEAEWLAR